MNIKYQERIHKGKPVFGWWILLGGRSVHISKDEMRKIELEDRAEFLLELLCPMK